MTEVGSAQVLLTGGVTRDVMAAVQTETPGPPGHARDTGSGLGGQGEWYAVPVLSGYRHDNPCAHVLTCDGRITSWAQSAMTDCADFQLPSAESEIVKHEAKVQ